jgi:hypothetical protein
MIDPKGYYWKLRKKVQKNFRKSINKSAALFGRFVNKPCACEIWDNCCQV